MPGVLNLHFNYYKNIDRLYASFLDGFVVEPKGEMDWIRADDEAFEYERQQTELADAALYGRNTCEMIHAYWRL